MTAQRIKHALRGLVSLSCLALALALVAGSSISASASSAALTTYTLVRAGSSNTVYVIAWSGCKQARCLTLYRTNVDASSFIKVALPAGATFSTLGTVVFANPSDGYVTFGGFYPSNLYATSNGGRTWRRVMSGHDVTYVVTASASEVLVSSVRCVPRTMDCGQYRVRRSSLAAKHWVTLPELWKTGSAKNEQYYGPSLAARASTLWVVETATSGSVGVYVWRSHDDGRTFSRTAPEFPQLVSVAGCSIDPMTTLTLWAECPTGMQVSFWHSVDGGVSWHQVVQRQFFGTGGGAFEPVTPTVAYLDYGGVVEKNNFVRLSDGGRVAQPVAEVKCTNVSLVFTTVERGLMVCNENYAHDVARVTSDGGATWTAVAFP